jgi:uncharacterized membrane protein
MLRWIKNIRWPWRKKPPLAPPKRTADALRRLYYNYQRQRRLWGYIVLSALMMSSLFIVFSLFTDTNLWVLTIPAMASIFSVHQMRRCGELVNVLRQALTVQIQIDKKLAEAEQKATLETEAAAEQLAEAQAKVDAQSEAIRRARAKEYAEAVLESQAQAGSNGNGKEKGAESNDAPPTKKEDEDEGEKGTEAKD